MTLFYSKLRLLSQGIDKGEYSGLRKSGWPMRSVKIRYEGRGPNPTWLGTQCFVSSKRLRNVVWTLWSGARVPSGIRVTAWTPNNKSCSSWLIPTMELMWNALTRQGEKSTSSCIRKWFFGDNYMAPDWWQKYQVFPPACDSSNTKYYVEGLVDSDGRWQTEENKVAKIAVDYYQTLFIASATTHMTEVIDKVDRVVTDDMRRTLMLPYTEEDVRVALFQMHPSKSSGLDSMSPYFFQKFWHIVGPDVMSIVLSVLHSILHLHKMNLSTWVNIAPSALPTWYQRWSQKSWLIGWRQFCQMSYPMPKALSCRIDLSPIIP